MDIFAEKKTGQESKYFPCPVKIFDVKTLL